MDQQQLLLAKYTADRTHELELNKISAQYELALPQVALVLNGASGTAFVSLVGANLRSIFDKAPVSSGLALAFWCVGILLALLAGYWAYEIQKRYAKAYRYRRTAIEITLRGRADEILFGHDKDATAESMGMEATRLRTDAGKHADWVKWFGVGSILCFAAGLASAACAVLRTL
jgi:hypothetical protein